MYFEWIYKAFYLISESCSEEIGSTCNDELILQHSQNAAWENIFCYGGSSGS